MIKKTFILFLLLTIFSSCQKNNDTFISHRGSFVKLKITHKVIVCDEKTCYQANSNAVASGFVIWHKGSTHVLTAGHACIYKIPKEVDTTGVKVTISTEIEATDLRSKKYDLKIVKINEKDDMCLLEGDVNSWPMVISDEEPKPGDKVYNFGAPAGIFSHNMVPIIEGLYSGYIESNMSAFTIPSMPGASGSPIVNRKGNLVGMIHSVHEDFSHFVLSPDLKTIKDFLN